MIVRQNSSVFLTCDCGCGEETDSFDREDFGHMISAAKAHGWRITQTSGEWEHFAPGCAPAEESALEKARRMFGRSK